MRWVNAGTGPALREDECRLLEAAAAARELAYAPYSGFKVGAAVSSAEGMTYAGCNVENASYGLTVCAERVAVFNAVSSGVRQFTTVAVVGSDPEPAAPCGACRQVIAEFSPDAVILMAGSEGRVIRGSVAGLLPHRFSLRPRPAGR
ncbi:MAG: cytidine deaminase [Firmicutes bacterium]|nr:cytidine deaminase [Bacillota bacterium]